MRGIVGSSGRSFKSAGDGVSNNPIVTVDEIQRRLQRPIPSPPPSPSRLPTSADLQPHDPTEKEGDSGKKKRQLGDYLDSKLLSAVSSTMKGDRWDREGEKKQRRRADFEWPAEELRALSEDGRRDRADGAVNFRNNLATAVNEDGIRGKGSCSPFRRFEEAVLTLSHRQ